MTTENNIINCEAPDDCPYHLGLVQQIKNLKDMLDKEIAERKDANQFITSTLVNKVDVSRRDIMVNLQNQCSAMEAHMDTFRTEMNLKTDSIEHDINNNLKLFKDDIKNKIKVGIESVNKTTSRFFIANITIWGALIVLLGVIFERLMRQ